MTQTFKNSRKLISGVGWSNPLTHDFQLENSSHLKLYADGTLLQLGVDYTLDEINNPAGYEVNIIIPTPGDEPVWWGNDIFILSVEPPVDQIDDLSLGGTYGQRYETALDRLTRRVQAVYDMALRAIKSPLSVDPSTLDQDTLVVDPDDIAAIAEGAAAAIAAADSAEADAAQTALDRIATGQDRVQTGLDRAAVAADKGTVAADKVIVAGDKATVAGDKATVAADKAIVAGYRDEVEDDRVDVQADKVIASAAADAAVAAQVAAEAAAAQALGLYEDFNDRYIGASATDPTTDIDGSPLEQGDLYFNTVSNLMLVWTGTAWGGTFVDSAIALLKVNNLGDLPSAATARTNLDVYSKSEVDALPGAAAGKTTPADADSVQIVDSAASNAGKRLTFANLKTWLQSWAWTFTQKVTTVASATGGAGLNLPHGAAPTSPVNGDLWTTSAAGLQFRQNGGTRTALSIEQAQTISGAKTHTGKVNTAASATGGAGFLIAHGAAPTSPVDGDVWTTTAGFFARINAATRTFLFASDIGTSVQAYSAALQNIATTITTAIAAAVGVTVQAFDAQLFSGIPVNSQSAAYTLLATDASKMIYHPAADTTARIWTIPANGSVPFPVGTVVTFDNDIGAGVITIAITTDTLVLVGPGTTGSRTLAAGGRATAIKVSSTRWRISGVGLT